MRRSAIESAGRKCTKVSHALTTPLLDCSRPMTPQEAKTLSVRGQVQQKYARRAAKLVNVFQCLIVFGRRSSPQDAGAGRDRRRLEDFSVFGRADGAGPRQSLADSPGRGRSDRPEARCHSPAGRTAGGLSGHVAGGLRPREQRRRRNLGSSARGMDVSARCRGRGPRRPVVRRGTTNCRTAGQVGRTSRPAKRSRVTPDEFLFGAAHSRRHV